MKIGKSDVFDNEKLVVIIYNLGYTEFTVLSKAWDKDYDWMGHLKDGKQHRHVLVSNNKKHVDLYILDKGKSTWIKSEKVDAVEEYVHDTEDKCDVDDEQRGNGDEVIDTGFEDFIAKKGVMEECEEIEEEESSDERLTK